jgi:hypothetical protein
MRSGLDLQVPPLFVVVEFFSCQRPLNIFGARVMALDQVAVVGVHHAHDVGKIRGRPRM